MEIDLTGLEAEWFEYESPRCAACGAEFDTMRDPDADPEEEPGNYVPLILWRKNGREALKLCWPCAQKRIRPAMKSPRRAINP